MCPNQAIEMRLNKAGTEIQPYVNLDRCNECGLCLRVCPGIGVDFSHLNECVFGSQPEEPLIGVFRKAWVGYSTDHALRFQSSSGGVVTELCSFALDEDLIDGAIVTDVPEETPLHPRPIVARSRVELIRASGSKYCPVAVNTKLHSIYTSDRQFAMVGLPCHIHGWRKAATRNKRLQNQIVYGLGLACGRVCNFSATEYYLKHKGIDLKDVTSIRYRGQGWPGKIRVTLKGGSEYIFPRRYSICEFHQALLHNASFGFQHFRPWRCLTCCDRAAELADISFSDPYLPRFFRTDHVGHTLIIARSERGEDLVEAASKEGRITLEEIAVEDVLKSHGGQLKTRKSVSAAFKSASLSGREVPRYTWSVEGTVQPASLSYSFACLLSIVERWIGEKRWAWPLVMPWSFVRTLFRYMPKTVINPIISRWISE
jgi:coenzyme F420 hydrogenase subunit beta